MPFPTLQSAFGYSVNPKGGEQGFTCLGTVSIPQEKPLSSIVWNNGIRDFRRFMVVYNNLRPSGNQSAVIQVSTNTYNNVGAANEVWVYDNYYNTDGAGATSDITGGLMLIRYNPYGTSGYAVISCDPNYPGQGVDTATYKNLVTIQTFTSTQFADTPGQSITVGQRNLTAPITALRLYYFGTTFSGTASLYGMN